MKIGNIDLGERPVMLAPMEDVTDPSFRLMCREQGAALVYTEFVSAEALVRNVSSTERKLTINDAERPVAIQIYGPEPEAMVEAAKIVERANPDIIDINFGCPVKKVARKGAGAGMLQNIPKLLDITKKVVNAVSLPVTVKTRLGWTCENILINDLAPRLQDCGIKALTVHGRTRSQMYTGQADWEPIRRLKEDSRIEIPIIGNGDICTPEQAVEAFDKYGVDGVMVGRASFGAPWIFRDMRSCIDTGNWTPMSVVEKFDLLRRQVRESIERIDEIRGILHIRRHLAATPLFKGLPDFRQTRIALLRATTELEILKIFDEIGEKYFKEELL
ncbi:MAG: tRNA dihydrouridine synthase DusB [Prevotella sp.]|nr:tRNA dihydrouridine synthase DusB [Bacteroides sp.]MCM1366977.1 tRNA dihydrouridine synthase DusB [Prevotella sp.]MCM1437486.1 tRNA dihydrouridine synthase DusB [Prevotella sp.]